MRLPDTDTSKRTLLITVRKKGHNCFFYRIHIKSDSDLDGVLL